MKSLLVTFLIFSVNFLSGCKHLKSKDSSIDSGTLIASVYVVDTAFKGPPKGTTGYEFYLFAAKSDSQKRIKGYEFRNGVLVAELGDTSKSQKLIEDIQNIGFEPFDFDQEVRSTTARLEALANANGESYNRPFALDGARYEIKINVGTGTFTLNEWNPQVIIDGYAAHNSKIAKLKAIFEILTTHSGKSRLFN